MNSSSESLKKTSIVFDTNVWLDFYSYSPTAMKVICDAIIKYHEHFIVPRQVYEEFLSRSSKVKNEKQKEIQQKRNSINNHSNRLKSDTEKLLNKLSDNGILSGDKSKEDIIEKIVSLQAEIIKCIDHSLECFEEKSSPLYDKDDIIQNTIEVLHEKWDYPEMSTRALINLIYEGEIRYKNNLPPGFSDDDKPDNRFGDLILWKEILRYSSDTSNSILLVQNETKGDWWEPNAPRQVARFLTKEFIEHTNGREFTMVNFYDFLKNHGNSFELEGDSISTIAREIEFTEKLFEYLESYSSEILRKSIKEHFNDSNKQYEFFSEGVVTELSNRDLIVGKPTFGDVRISKVSSVFSDQFNEGYHDFKAVIAVGTKIFGKNGSPTNDSVDLIIEVTGKHHFTATNITERFNPSSLEYSDLEIIDSELIKVKNQSITFKKMDFSNISF